MIEYGNFFLFCSINSGGCNSRTKEHDSRENIDSTYFDSLMQISLEETSQQGYFANLGSMYACQLRISQRGDDTNVRTL